MTTNPTTNYAWQKPVPGTEIDVWGPILNTNLDSQDPIVKGVSDVANAALPKAGGVMTGAITLPGNPATALIAAPKQYVDLMIPLAGGVMTGQLTLNGNPGSALIAAPKQYVDTFASLTSPNFLGTPTAPTDAPGGNSQIIATTAFVKNATDTAVSGKSDKGIADGQTSYAVSSTLALTDAGATVLVGAAGAIIITIPPQSSVVWLARTRIDIIRTGAGEVSIAAGAGVTINSDTSKLRLNVQYAAVSLFRSASNVWYLLGNLKT